MEVLKEDVNILNQIVSNISIRLQNFDERFDEIENRLCGIDKRFIDMSGRISDIDARLPTLHDKKEENKARTFLHQKRFLLLGERAVKNNCRRIDSVESRGTPPQESRLSLVNVAFQDEPGEVVEMTPIRADGEEAVEKLHVPKSAGKMKNVYLHK